MTTVAARLRRSSWTLPLATVAALLVLVISESAYRDASKVLVALGDRGTARTQIQTLLRRLIDAETGQRGYLLTGRKDYLDPYSESVKDVNEALAALATYYAAEPAAAARVAELAKRSREKLSEITATLGLYDSGRHESWQALMLTDIGREKMDAVRDESEALLALESQRVATDRASLQVTLRASRYGVAAMVALSLLALALFLRQTRRYDALQREAAAAMQAERDKLEVDVQRRTADLTELAQHLQTAREDERSRLARELHDELGALLTAAKLDAARLKRSLGVITPDSEARLKHLNDTINDGIGLKRRIIEDLRPSSLSNLGLVAALQIQASEFAQRSELPVQTELNTLPLPPDSEITVYRLVQESLTNIAKYAQASEVQVRLVLDQGRALVSVRDNGKGFDPQQRRQSAHGLMGMRYRVEAIGGLMQVTAAPGAGTTVQAWLPLL
jgi:signal transduction histidine kinase